MTESAAPPPGPSDGPDPALKPTLGLFDASMIVMGSIIGAGIFNVPQSIAQHTGSLGGMLLVWVLGGLFALSGAIVFAELGGLLPRTGGQYVFVREGYGRFAAFLFGWILVTAIVSPAIAGVANVFTDHLHTVLVALGWVGPGAWSLTTNRAVALALILVLTGLNVRGLRLGATVQNLAMLAKIGGMALIVLLGAAVVVGWLGPVAPPAPRSADLAPLAFSWAGVAAALLPVVFTYGGFQNVASVASEIKRPHRNLPLGILLGTLGVIALYLALNGALVAILGVEGVAATSTPVATAAGAVFPVGAPLVAGLVMLSTFAIVQVLLMLAPRIYYAMARDGVFFRSAAWVHPRYRTPVVAILVQGLFSALHVFLGKNLSEHLQITVLADAVFFAACGLALFGFRRTRPDAPRPYRAHGYPWLPAFFVLFTLLIVGNSVYGAWGAGRVAVLVAGGLFASGGLLYLVWNRGGSAPAD